MRGICALCQLPSELRDSHLIPAAAYKCLRDSRRSNPHPVNVARGRALASSKQVSDHLLCAKCEQRLSDNGEKYVLSRCRRTESNFQLRDAVLRLPVIDADVFGTIRNLVGADRQLIDQCAYFGASIFWRASVHQWKSDGRTLETARLGPYQEEFRSYLLGTAGFPPHAVLVLLVTEPDMLQSVIMVPSTESRNGMKRHKFSVPGLVFTLFVGRRLPSGLTLLGLAPTPNAVMVGSAFADEWFLNGVRAATNSRPLGSLRR